jgi:acrylyl-CoA reductase (NADPH)
MAATFRALLATKDGDQQSVAVTELTEADLMGGEVTVAVEHSTVNHKDGLAITGKLPIIRQFPLIPGVDLAGRVLRSEDPCFQAGDRVVVNGYGLGEVHHGGYAERAPLGGIGLSGVRRWASVMRSRFIREAQSKMTPRPQSRRGVVVPL